MNQNKPGPWGDREVDEIVKKTTAEVTRGCLWIFYLLAILTVGSCSYALYGLGYWLIHGN